MESVLFKRERAGKLKLLFDDGMSLGKRNCAKPKL